MSWLLIVDNNVSRCDSLWHSNKLRARHHTLSRKCPMRLNIHKYCFSGDPHSLNQLLLLNINEYMPQRKNPATEMSNWHNKTERWIIFNLFSNMITDIFPERLSNYIMTNRLSHFFYPINLLIDVFDKLFLFYLDFSNEIIFKCFLWIFLLYI